MRREASARMTRRVSQMSEMAKSAPSQSTWPPSSAVWLGDGKLARACPRLCMKQAHVILRPAKFYISNLGLQSLLISSP